MQRRNTALAITSLSIVLPPSVHSPYFYDIVGNVSTSRFRPSRAPSFTPHQAKLPSQRKAKPAAASTSLLELTPRYPLMGGWNYTFTIGYDAPLSDYVKVKKGAQGKEYVLAVPFLTPVKDVAVDIVTLTIRLPEGARCVCSSLLSSWSSVVFGVEN
jgi:oligosaccharyltransferase complex subunit alpha (ribophorin I)